MHSDFSQGIKSYPTIDRSYSGLQKFLVTAESGAKVQLYAPIVSGEDQDQKFITLFAHQDTHYSLNIANGSNIDAWGYGPDATNAEFSTGTGGGDSGNVFYLYIDINRSTGEISYGWSKYDAEYVSGSGSTYRDGPFIAGTNRLDDQHWFNTSSNTMYMWHATGTAPTYGNWVEKIRCFVGKYTLGGGGNTFASVSGNETYYGTKSGLVGNYRIGSLIYDSNGNVLKRTATNNSTVFFTTEDIFATGLPTSSRTRLESFVVDGIAQQPIAAYQAVYFSDLNEILPLTADKMISGEEEVIFGIIEEPAAASGILVKVTTNGVINNSTWTWTSVNELIYVDSAHPGVLVSVEKDGYTPLPGQKPIGIAIDSTTIFLRASELVLAVEGINNFVRLFDTPSTFDSAGSTVLYVNADEDAIEFGATLANLADVNTSMSASPGDILYVNSITGKWTAAAPGGTSGTQAWDLHLDQIAALSGATNQFIVGSASNVWTAKTPANVKTILNITMSDITDVDIAGSPILSTNDILRWDGTNWIPFDGDTAYTQDVFKTVIGDTGSTIAVGTTDTINITGGTNISTTGTSGSPNTLQIDWVGSLDDLSDVELAGSPIPIMNDVLTYTGSAWEAQPVQSSATQALPRPYDFAAQTLGNVGSDDIIFRYIAPRDFILFDYGHQADSETRPPTDMDFDVTLNGVTIGTFRYYDTEPSTVAFNFVDPTGFPQTDGSPVTGVVQHQVSTGDVLKIVTPTYGSPAGEEIAGFEDVSITLRGAVEPVAPIGSISVSFDPFSGTVGNTNESVSINVTGEYAYIEYAVIAYADPGSPAGVWYPMDDNSGFLNNGRGIYINDTLMSSESQYVVATNTTLNARRDFTGVISGVWFRLQATAFGPGGIATSFIDLQTS